MTIKTAILLAAGRGERLKPITLNKPKAMCEVQGLPLIGHHLKQLSASGFEKVIINHAYLGDQIRNYVSSINSWNLEIIFSPEPTGGLETGGTIVDVLPLIGDEPFITVSADIFTQYPLYELKAPNENSAHIVLIPKLAYASKGDFGIQDNYVINDNLVFTFGNIACFRPDLFAHFKPGRFSMTPFLRSLANEQRLTGEVHHGLWFDIGTPERLNMVNGCVIPAQAKIHP